MENQLLNKDVEIPKLRIAEELGVLKDPRWLGEGIDELRLSGNTPRHRVIARLAREERWHRLWTVNWDCLLEMGLESVGFIHRTDWQSKDKAPWKTKYNEYVVRDDLLHIGEPDCIHIIKPNGCARALRKAKEEYSKGNISEAKKYADRFLITQRELNAQNLTDPSNNSIYLELASDIQSRPFLVIGWRIQEEYIQKQFESTRNGHPTNGHSEEFTVIDLQYQDTHEKVASYYQLDGAVVFVPVRPGAKADLDTNELFLLIQAFYALDCMKQNHIQVSAELEAVLLDSSSNKNLILWADEFLPAWTRLCALTGLTKWLIGGSPVIPEVIKMDLPDYHIPWKEMGPAREDMKSALRLIERIYQSTSNWILGAGYLWNPEEGHLVLPLPAWGEGDLNILRGLPPLLKRIESKKGFISKISVLPLDHDPQATLPTSIQEDIENKLRAVSHFNMIVSGGPIRLLMLEDL